MGSALATPYGEVQVLTEAKWDSFLEEHAAGTLVEFYAPWCGHCKKLEPEFDAAATLLKEQNIEIPLAKVDATVESGLAQKQGIQGYPTLKYFVNGEPSEYDGPRDTAGIVAWIKQISGPAVVEGEPDLTAKFTVTYYGAEEPEVFGGLAKNSKYRKMAAWHFVKSDKNECIIRHLGEPEIKQEGTDELEAFFKANSFPLFGSLDGDTFGQYVERGNGLIWILLKMTKETHKEVVEENRAEYTKIATEFGEKYSVAHTNTADFEKVLESMFGITEFPRVVVQTKAGDKKNFIYDGEMTADAIIAYIKDVDSGKIEANLKSEEIPADQTGEPVKVIVGKNFQESVFTETKDVLLEVYAPWCGHCKKLEPEYIKVGKKVIKEGFEDILTIAKMDGTLNDSPVESITWTGFPTIYYVKAGNSEPLKYDGGRDAKGIWKWIKNNHSKAQEIKDKIAANKTEKKTEGEEKKHEEL